MQAPMSDQPNEEVAEPEHPAEAAQEAPPAETPQPPRERFQQAAAEKQGADDPEDDLWSGSYSHLAMIGSWIGGGVASVAGVILGVMTFTSASAWLILLGVLAVGWLILASWYFYRRMSVSYELTSQRLIHEAGLLWRTVDRVELIDVDDVTYRQGPVERMLGVGTILVTSSDKTTPELLLPGIENVREVADKIDDARRKERRSRGLHIEAV